MPAPKLHHHLPQCYQRGFSRDDRVWVFDRVTRSYRHDHPRNVAAITHDYSFEIAGRREPFLEEIFAEIDGEACTTIRKLRRGDNLGRPERFLFSLWLALFDVRVPRFRRWLNEFALARENFQEQLPKSKEDVEQFLELSGMNANPRIAQAGDFIAQLLTLDADAISGRQNTRLQLLVQRATLFSERILALRWVVAHLERDALLITSDYPLLAAPNDDLLIFPLAVDCALAMFSADVGGPELVHGSSVPADLLESSNVGFAQASERVVVARDEEHLRTVIEKAGILHSSPDRLF